MRGRAGGDAFVSGAAGLEHLEEGGPIDQAAVTQSAQQGHEPIGQHQPGTFRGLGDKSGEVDQFASDPDGTDGDGDHPEGLKQLSAAGEDASEPVQQFVEAAVGEVARVGGIAVVGLLDLSAAVVTSGSDVSVRVRSIGRRGQHERDLAA